MRDFEVFEKKNVLEIGHWGVEPDSVVIYDRNSASSNGILRNEMITAGYKLNESSGSVKVIQSGEFDPEGSWPYGGIIIAADPVAADTVALKILREKREQENVNYFVSVPLDV